MSIAAYVWGIVVLGGSIGLVGLGADALGRVLYPSWRGALGVLSRVALGLCWVFAVAYVLGAVGWFRSVPLFGLVDGGALMAWWLLRPRSVTCMPRPGAACRSQNGSVVAVMALVGVVLVVGAWLPGTVHAYRYGILEPDSVWYHGHFSARFVQTGWLTRLNPVGVDALVPFHTANREVLDAVLVLPWHRDIALPLLNLVYLALLLLAGWCIGQRWDRGPLALLVTALTASAPVMILSHPGSLKNDLLATALLLTAVALFLHSDGHLPAVGLAGATLGLAAGTKSNLLLLVLVLLGLGAVWLLRRYGWRTAAAWVTAIGAFGSYWYLRNWIRAGNPLPWMDLDLGSLHLSQVKPGDGSEGWADRTVAKHFDQPRFLLDSVVRPGLRGAFGKVWWGWPVLLVGSLGLVIRSVWDRAGREGSGWIWGLAGAGTVGLVAHPFTPLSLVVPPENPASAFNFAFNTRYALPAALLVLLAGACAARPRWVELTFGAATLALIVCGLFPTPLSSGVAHDGEAADAVGSVALGLGVAAVAAWFLLQRPRPRLALVPAVLVGVLAVPVVDRYLDGRYSTPTVKLGSQLWPTTSRLEDARIGIATDPTPYPNAGADDSNRVEYIGVPLQSGSLRNASSCEEWGQIVRSLDLTHVALAPEPFVLLLSAETMEAWTLAIPGTRVVERRGNQVLIEVPDDPPPTPDGACPPG